MNILHQRINADCYISALTLHVTGIAEPGR